MVILQQFAKQSKYSFFKFREDFYFERGVAIYAAIPLFMELSFEYSEEMVGLTKDMVTEQR